MPKVSRLKAGFDRRERCRIGAAVNQRRTNPGFQRLDPPAQSRLRDVSLRCRSERRYLLES